VAEHVLKFIDLDRELFLVGNLAPDCNRANEDWSAFTPDAKITHFRRVGTKTEPDLFLDAHFQAKDDVKKKSFLLGYYAHLLTDNMWGDMIRTWKEENPHIKEKMEADKSYIWTIKKDWYGQDFKYLRENKANVFVNEFLGSNPVRGYLEFFPADIMNEKLAYIKDFYTSPEKEIHMTEYKYLTSQQMDTFVDSCSRALLNKIANMI